MLGGRVVYELNYNRSVCLTIVFSPSATSFPAMGLAAELLPHCRESHCICCNPISLLNTRLPLVPGRRWLSVWSGCVWVIHRLHPWVLALSHQEEKSISWQAALPGCLASQSVLLCGKLVLPPPPSFIVIQDIHRKTCLVPEREPAPHRSTLLARSRATRVSTSFPGGKGGSRVVWFAAVKQDFLCWQRFPVGNYTLQKQKNTRFNVSPQ